MLFLAISFAVAALGTAATFQNVDGWYADADKAFWTPPNVVFGPVWTLLYTLMSVAAWLVWRERGFARARGALGLFLLQLAANAVWSWLFFAWHLGGAAFADILAMLALIVATLVAFGRIRRAAAWLLAPYLAWVSFAALLNYSVWQLNPHAL